MKKLAFLVVPLITIFAPIESAHAETYATIKQRVMKILQNEAGVSSDSITYLTTALSNPQIYATAAELLAATPADGSIGYALDTDVFYVMTASAWVSIATLATMANGATITNSVDGAIKFLETSEDLVFTATNNLWTLSSSTGATIAFTPAVGFTGDITVSGAAGGITWGAAGSELLADNSATSLDIGSTGATNMIRFDTQNGLEKVIVNAEMIRSPAVFDSFAEGASKGLHLIKLDGTAFDGATGIYNLAYTSLGRSFLVSALGAGQTASPAMVAAGLDISGDDADNEGYFIEGGRLGASGRPFIIGTDPAFKGCWTVNIADVSITDDFHVGFMRPQTTETNFDDFDDLASIGINASAATAAIKLETILNDGATTSTDTTDTWADGASKTLCVLVSAAGVVTYTNGGIAPTVTAAFTFDDGDPVVPFLWFIHSSAAAIGVVIEDWSVSYQ